MTLVELQEPELHPHLGFREVVDEHLLEPGSRVEVKRRFDAKWARGFEVLEHVQGCYRLRRLSDGAPLPVLFAADDVRPARRNNTWWI